MSSPPAARRRCFGLNDFGQLGQGDTDARGQTAATMGDSLGPVDLGTVAIVVDMAAGSDHTCVVLDLGDVKVTWRRTTHGNFFDLSYVVCFFVKDPSCSSIGGVFLSKIHPVVLSAALLLYATQTQRRRLYAGCTRIGEVAWSGPS